MVCCSPEQLAILAGDTSEHLILNGGRKDLQVKAGWKVMEIGHKPIRSRSDLLHATVGSKGRIRVRLTDPESTTVQVRRAPARQQPYGVGP